LSLRERFWLEAIFALRLGDCFASFDYAVKIAAPLRTLAMTLEVVLKYIALDIGDKRVGVACGDVEVRIATPLEVILRSSIELDARALAKITRDYDAAQLIVGLPRNMDGTQGAQAEAVIAYAEKIAQALHLPLTFWDERLSTVEATRRAHETGARGKKSRRNLDAIAAAVILQDFLDSQSGSAVEDTGDAGKGEAFFAS
jgi:putative Holliday junction resolvase